MEVDSWLTGRRGIGLPFTDECEPVTENEAAVEDLFQESLKLGKQRGWKSVELRGGCRYLKSTPPALSFYTHTLDLTPPINSLVETFDPALRRGIRKAEKEGVKVEITQSSESMQTFYRLQCQTRRRHGLPPQPFVFFLNIYRYILSQNLGMIGLASYQGRPIAAAVYFYLGDRAIYKFGASDYRWQRLRPNNQVMWAAIQWLAGRGAKTLHLGRTSLGHDGLRRFKLAWNPREQTIKYVKYDLRKKSFVTEKDETSGWYNTAFRLMPSACSRLAGRLLYKHWA